MDSGQFVAKVQAIVYLDANKVGKDKGVTGQYVWKTTVIRVILIIHNVLNASMGFIEITMQQFVHSIQIPVHPGRPLAASASCVTTDAEMV